MSDESMRCRRSVSESERNVEDCKITLRHMVIGVRSNPTMHANILQALALSYHDMSWTARKNTEFIPLIRCEPCANSLYVNARRRNQP